MKILITQFLAAFLLYAAGSTTYAQVVTDKAGFNWDFTVAGDVTEGTEDAFDGAYQLFVDSNQFTGGNTENENGMVVFGPQTLSGVVVKRHAILIDDPPGIFYADHFQNVAGERQSFTPSIASDFGEAANSQVRRNEDGKMLAMLHPHDAPRPHLINVFGSEGDDYLPTLAGSGDTYQFNFPQMILQPGEERTIGFFVAQRRAAGGPGMLANEEIYARALEHANSIGNFAFPNSFGGGIFNTGRVRLTQPAGSDFISTKKKDKVFGKLLVNEFQLETEIGIRTYSIDQIINIVGSTEGRFRVVGADGSILDGKLTPNRIKFELSDGIEGEIDAGQLEKIVPKKSPAFAEENWKKGKWFEFSSPVFVFKSGERLTGSIEKGSITVHSEIGQIKLPTERLVSIRNGKKGNPSKFVTKDGQAFSGVFYDLLEVTIFDGSIRKISPKDLETIYFDEPSKVTKTNAKDQAYLKLSGNDFLYVKLLVDKQPLEFATAFGTRTMNPEQISSLKAKRGFDQSMDITLWDGSSLNGKLTNQSLWVELLGVEMKIPSSQIEEFENPMALPPNEVRQKYIKLIHELGSKKYGDRAKAIKILESEKAKLRGLFKSQIDLVSVEAKAQIWKLLPPKDRPKQKKKPNVKKVAPVEGANDIDNPPR